MGYIATIIVAVLDLAFRVYKHIKSDNRPPDQE